MQTDILIIGSGAAGLTAALQLAQKYKVTVLAKGALSDGATAWAQGGIAAVLEPGDTFESHIEDTMIAGAGLNNRATVEFVIEHAPQAIDRLASSSVMPLATISCFRFIFGFLGRVAWVPGRGSLGEGAPRRLADVAGR